MPWHECSRGHRFHKTSDCPVCPSCWAGYYKGKTVNDLPKLGGPALRALLNENIDTLRKLSKRTEKEILELHGMGPGSMLVLKKTLKEEGLAFKTA